MSCDRMTLPASGTTLSVPVSSIYVSFHSILSSDGASRTSIGWNETEADVFRRALMRFGIGQWKDIIESGCLPGKTNAQMNIQLQRMLGQQSVAGGA